MYWLGISLLVVPAALRACVLALMGRRHLYRRFPIFAAYTAYVIASSVLKAVFLSKARAYFYVYWISEPGEVVLSVLSIYESFIRVFGDFYRLIWFRVLFPATILVVLAYSSWTAYAHPPVGVNGIASAIISTAIAAQYVILGISVLFLVLARFLQVRWRVYESRIVMGFGVASTMYAFAGVLRAEAGKEFQFVSEYLPAVGYVIAAGIWLSAMLVRQPWIYEGVPPGVDQDLLQRMRLQLQTIKKLLGKNGSPPGAGN